MLASTWMDPVLGLDTHIVGIPAPPAPAPVPTPVPMPFIGMVFDPVGAAFGAALGAGPVLVNGMFATNCGSNVTNLACPHLPAPGVMFIPPPKPSGDAELMFGALDVSFGGSLAVRLGEIALSCSDPRRMPTSVVLAIPKGAPVLILRPPVPDLATIAMAGAMRGLMRGLGAVVRRGGRLLRAMQRAPGSRWRSASSAVHAMVERMAPRRVRDAMHRSVCFLTGHPVDVATGRVLTDRIDVELPGPLPLRLHRHYSSSLSWRDGPVGRGWSHSLDQAAWLEPNKVVYLAEDGREIEFDTTALPDRVIRAGGSVYHPVDRLTLRCLGPWHFEVETAGGVVHELARVPGSADRARLIAVRNRTGDRIAFAYDGRARLETVRDSAGRTVTFEHDRADRLVRVSVAAPGTPRVLVLAEYGYDDAGDLVEARDAAGQAFRFGYADHLLVKETNRNGLSFYFQYDGLGPAARCIRTWGDGGIHDHELVYDVAGRKTLVEDSLGFTTVYELSEAGQVVAVRDALGAKTNYEYDPATGRKTKQVDPLGGETAWVYDARGNCVKIIGPAGAAVEVTFDERNAPVRAIDAGGGEWRWGYDEKGRVVGRVDPLGRRTQYEWRGGRLVGFHDPAGRPTRLAYDEQGNLTALVTPDGAESRWSWDLLGRCTAVTNANGSVETRERDPLGRVVRVREPDGNVRELAYDAEGNLVHARDRQHDVRFTYQGMGRLATRTEAGTTIRFTYDTEERVTGVENEQGAAYRFERGATGNVDVEVGFDGSRRRYEHDAAGRVTIIRRPAGRVTRVEYDPCGRVVQVRHADGAQTQFTYRPDGQLVEATNATASVVFERDALGRITKEICGDDWVESEYDALGMRVRVRSSRGLAQTIQRNAGGAVEAVTASVGEEAPFTVAFGRDRLGLEVERMLAGGVRASWERDATGRPTHHALRSGDAELSARRYVWGPNDRLQSIIDSLDGPVAYEHDARGGLVAATHADGRVELRLPDAVGNLFRTRSGTDRVYGPAGELRELRGPDGVTRLEYDGEGNLTRKVLPDGRVWAYQWDDAGMLARVVRPDGAAVDMGYDPLGRRVWKRFGGVTTRWLWDGAVPLHEWREAAAPPTARPAPVANDGAGRVRAASLTDRLAQGPPPPTTWIFEPESHAPLAKLVAGDGAVGIVTDHLGTPRAMFDGRGAMIWSAELGVTGEVRAVTGDRAACPFRWPGQYEDQETGLHYNRHRYYDPSTGLYLSQDPIGLAGGLRLYAYVRDPLTWADPLGLENIVFRALRPADMSSLDAGGPMSPRVPGATATPMEHVLHGSDPTYPGDQFISVTRDRGLAESWARRSGTEVAEIDLDRVSSPVRDLSTGPGRAAHLGDPSGALPGSDLHRANRFARGAQELLVEGDIPNDAVVRRYCT